MQADSLEFSRIAAEARAIADGAGQPFSSAHLLLALFTVPTPADLVLRARRVDEDVLLRFTADLPAEPDGTASALLERAREIARGTGSGKPKALHLVVALANARDSSAHALLVRAGVKTADLGRESLSYAVGPLPRRFIPKEPLEPTPPPTPRPRRDSDYALASRPPPVRSRGATLNPAPPRRTAPTVAPSVAPTVAPSVAPTTVPTAAPTATPTLTPTPSPPAVTAAPGEPRTSNHSYGYSRPVLTPSAFPMPGSPPVAPPSSPPTDPGRTSRLSALRRITEGLEPEPASATFALSPDEYPYLASLGRNLTELAAAGRIDPVIGRDHEIEEVLDILGKRRSNNPILVGDPGVGKTAVVEGVARCLADDAAASRVLVELDVAALVAGTQLRGSLSEKLTGIKDEVRRANGRVVVFIDEIHTLIGAGATGDGPQDAAGELKAALARGEFPCIGATTWAELQKYFVQDPALERRFVPVRVDEPSIPDAVEILRGVASRYAEHHGVRYDDAAIEAAATLSARHVPDRCLPDKALAVLDHAGSRARREGDAVVTRNDVARVVARMAGVPEDRVLLTDAERMLQLESELSSRIVGHGDVIQRVAAAVRRNFAGFSGRRPLASFIFLGPTGVGKTELARGLASAVYGPDALVRIDMSELTESHSVARLVGAPPGYVGFGEGGQLTEAVRRRPASVVLFDEIEKAHRDCQQLLLQLLDEGHLTDSRGRRVDFTSTIVVLTSNLGADAFGRSVERTVGFGAGAASQSPPADRALEVARSAFPPELWNRIEERLVFHPLTREDIARIARLLASESSARLEQEKRIRFELSEEAVLHLLENGGYDEGLGARPMRQTLGRLVEAPLAEQILRGLVQSGDRLQVVVRAGALDFEQLTVVDASPGRAHTS